MSLASSADGCAQDIVNAIGAKPEALAQWKSIVEQLAAWITANGTVTIPPASIVTTGSPTTQTGPPAPIVLGVS